MKKICMIMLVMLMSTAVLTGCTSETENVASDEVSEAVSENSSEISEDILPEEVEEESAEEVSEEMAEEVDYSAEAVMALCDELTAKYPNENVDYIRALVIGMNIDYMDSADVDMVMSTYGYTLEQLNENFIAMLEVKRELFDARERNSVGNYDEYENNRYKDNILINECCLNIEDANECRKFENTIDSHADELYSYVDEVIANYEDNKINYVVIMVGVSKDFREKLVPGFDINDNTFLQYSNALTQ